MEVSAHTLWRIQPTAGSAPAGQRQNTVLQGSPAVSERWQAASAGRGLGVESTEEAAAADLQTSRGSNLSESAAAVSGHKRKWVTEALPPVAPACSYQHSHQQGAFATKRTPQGPLAQTPFKEGSTAHRARGGVSLGSLPPTTTHLGPVQATCLPHWVCEVGQTPLSGDPC